MIKCLTWKNICRSSCIFIITSLVFCYLFFSKLNLTKDMVEPVSVGEIVQNTDVLYTFSAEKNNLTSISITLATFCRQNNANIIVELYEEVDKLVVKNIYNGADVEDNKEYYLHFNPIRDSRGKSYTIHIYSDNGILGDALTTYMVKSELLSDVVYINSQKYEKQALFVGQQYYYLANWAIYISIGTLFFFAVLWFIESNIKSDKLSLVEKKVNNNFDWSTHYFRGFAIICICLMHFLSAIDYNHIVTAFFTSSSIYFLFISGYLNYFLSKKRLETPGHFYKKKFKTIICPYLFFTTVVIFISLLQRHGLNWGPSFEQIKNGKEIAKIFILGLAQGPYWYIPFVSLIFVVTPFIVRLENNQILMLFILSFIISLIFPIRGSFKPPYWPNVFYLYTYFSWYYLLGFVYYSLRNQIDCFLNRYVTFFLIIFVFIGIKLLNLNIFNLEIVENDWIIGFQKFAGICVALVFLKKIQKRKIKLLDLFARYSFTLFFTHSFFIKTFVELKGYLSSIGFHIFDLVIVICYLLTILFFSIILKNAFGKYSRYSIRS